MIDDDRKHFFIAIPVILVYKLYKIQVLKNKMLLCIKCFNGFQKKINTKILLNILQWKIVLFLMHLFLHLFLSWFLSFQIHNNLQIKYIFAHLSELVVS